MEATVTFYAKIHQGTMHNRQANMSRQARWIEARDIPLQCLTEDYGSPLANKLHPHNVEGLVWDLDNHDWRRADRASSHSLVVDSVHYDRDDRRLIYR